MSFAEVLAEDLGISLDSAYRRIRGDTHLTFEEIMIICSRYDVSLESFFPKTENGIIFNYRAVSQADDISVFFKSILKNLETCRKYKAREIIYAAKEIPVFHLFMFPGLTAFKILFWFNSIFQLPAYRNKSFSLELLTPEIREITDRIYESYLAIPSTEIWNEDSICVILRQIDFLYRNNKFENLHQPLSILDELKELTIHMEKQASACKKQRFNKNVNSQGNTFHLYNNRIIISENTVFYKMGESSMVHLGHNVINIISTIEPEFCRHTYSILQNLISKSICLHGNNVQERENFFKKMRNRIDKQIKSIRSL